jgi:hypothetical protein
VTVIAVDVPPVAREPLLSLCQRAIMPSRALAALFTDARAMPSGKRAVLLASVTERSLMSAIVRALLGQLPVDFGHVSAGRVRYTLGMANVVFAFCFGVGAMFGVYAESRWGWPIGAALGPAVIIGLFARQWLRLRQANREGRGIYVKMAGPGSRDA